jgi:hypothetical protein
MIDLLLEGIAGARNHTVFGVLLDGRLIRPNPPQLIAYEALTACDTSYWRVPLRLVAPTEQRRLRRIA